MARVLQQHALNFVKILDTKTAALIGVLLSMRM